MKHYRYALQGATAFILMSLSTIVLTLIMCFLAFFKLIIPPGSIRNMINRWLSCLGELWVSVNRLVLWFYRGMEWDLQTPQTLDRTARYLVLCNHQSWVDILVLQFLLNRQAPFMRFMLKQKLAWVPVLGVAWWALDMPFLRRYSRQQLLKNPALRGKDLESAARACEKLRHIPVSMMVFPEGTRFTREKHTNQNPNYKHLLLPRFGAIGQVLYSFGDGMQTVIDVSIYYPDGVPTFWQLVSGQVRNISAVSSLRPISENLRGINFRENKVANQELRAWLNEIWLEKDQHLIEAGKK